MFSFWRQKKKKIIKSNNLNQELIKFSQMDKGELLNHFGNTENGFKTEEAEQRLEEVGLNEIETEGKITPWHLVQSAFLNPFILLLLVIIIITIFTDVIFAQTNDYSTIIILSLIIIISGIMHFIQDYRSQKSLQALQKMIINTTAVKRDGKFKEIPLTEVVPGDLLKLVAGDMLPADARLLTGKDLFVSQSSFTGEAEPIEKFPQLETKTTAVFSLSNLCFMGTNVISGTATAIALKTGSNTYLGEMAKTIDQQQTITTAFDEGIKKVSMILIRLTILMTILVFIINALTKGDFLMAFMFALTIAVGVTPELLPMIVTSNLAKGSLAMAKQKTIVKSLSSIQNLGAIDILCTDKTGTITEDNIILDEHLDIYGKENKRVLKYAYLNSYFQTGLKNTLDLAVIDKAERNEFKAVLNDYIKVDEIPFDFSRRRMSIILEKKKGEKRLITKGAVAEVLAICNAVETNGEVKKMTANFKKIIMETTGRLNQKGFRVLAVARKNDNIADTKSFAVKDEKEMILMGFVTFLDPPKADAKEAIKLLQDYGVNVKVITGDNESVAKTICTQVGIKIEHCLEGEAVSNLTDEELLKKIEQVTLFSKIAPLQKARLIELMQQKGHVVGYLGDGINDAPALMQADVGISVDTGVEIAKEAADIILLQKSLLVLGRGIKEGRKVFANIMKYLKMATSSNVGNMISVIVASIFLPFLPLLPIHILVQNLLYDFSQTGIPFDHVDKEHLVKPQKWTSSNIVKFITWFAPTSSIFDFIMFAILWYLIGANTIGTQALFHSGWFIMGVISQTLIVYILRTGKVPFYKSKPATPIIMMTLLITVIGLILPSTSLGHYLGLVTLPGLYFFWLVVVMLGYVFLTEIVKQLYQKYYKW